jgi:hypothetical protein
VNADGLADVEERDDSSDESSDALISTHSFLSGREANFATYSDDPTTPDSNTSGRKRHLTLNTALPTTQSPPHIDDDTEVVKETKGAPVSWRALPRKDQLLVLVLARLSEPLTQNSLGSYIYYQLRSFDPSLPDSTISYQAGVIHAAFPAAQCLTAILWGRFADWKHGGRKRVIWIGLLGTMLSMIGFGFSHSFAVAVVFRCMGGVLNGNIGVMRTLISEIIKEKKYQSRAFSILPMTFNMGVIIGPILGTLLGLVLLC